MDLMKEINHIVLKTNEEEKSLRSHMQKYSELRNEIQEKIDYLVQGNKNEKSCSINALDELERLEVINQSAKSLLVNNNS